MSSRKRIIGLSVVILAFATVGYMKFHKPTTPPVKTITVSRGKIVDKAIAIGQILPERSIKVKSQVSGIVARLLHQEGEYIKAGDGLLQIQPTPSPENYDRLKREVDTQRVVEQARKLDLEIKRKAYALGVNSRSEYIDAEEKYKTAQLNRHKAEEQLALIEKGNVVIADRKISSEITSPIDGYILDRTVNEGDPVVAQSEMQPGDVLFTIADMQHLLFRGEVNELDAVKLSENMPATLIIGALPEIKINGKVTKIALQSLQASADANQTNQTNKTNTSSSKFNVGFKVEISDLQIPPNVVLKSGYSATAEIIVKQVKDALLLPERVLVFKEGNPYVQLPEADGKSKLQLIKTGISDGVKVQILEGLQEGQEVIDKPMGKTAEA